MEPNIISIELINHDACNDSLKLDMIHRQKNIGLAGAALTLRMFVMQGWQLAIFAVS
jgi:hypothetical protein